MVNIKYATVYLQLTIVDSLSVAVHVFLSLRVPAVWNPRTRPV